LELKIERMEALAKETQSIAALDIGNRVFERIQAERRAWMKSIADQVAAEAAEQSE
jgi:putative methionine-R-sulfoxide reductase with GAF domain